MLVHFFITLACQISNSIRVVKTVKQTSDIPITYIAALTQVPQKCCHAMVYPNEIVAAFIEECNTLSDQRDPTWHAPYHSLPTHRHQHTSCCVAAMLLC